MLTIVGATLCRAWRVARASANDGNGASAQARGAERLPSHGGAVGGRDTTSSLNLDYWRLPKDYDADGATATAVAMKGLRALGARVNFLVPNRFEYGYGLTPEIVELAAQRQPDILLTTDLCG